MSRVCTVCTHADRPAIDAALIAGQALRDIGQRHGLSKDALFRHQDGHIPARMAKAQGAAEVAQADDLLRQLRKLQGKSVSLLLKAEQAGDYRTALAGIREARGCLELLAKLTDQLDDRPTINVLMAPEWVQVRAAMLEALHPYPEARAAVSGRLVALEASR